MLSGTAGCAPMAHAERQISVERVTGVAGPLYRLDIEPFDSFLVEAEPVSRVLASSSARPPPAPSRC